MRFDPESLAAAVARGELPATARACRLVDDRAPGHSELLQALYPASGAAWRIGITGHPGAGKSTLVDRMIALLRARGERVGVVAVDPTSPFSGGAVLGDRVRLQRHFEDSEVFIRSLATRGALGGLSHTTLDVVRVLEAWGAAVIVIETVGIGQDELDVTYAADSTLVVTQPGLGDHIQAAKAGILECADVFAVNKADQPGADASVRDLQAMLSLTEVSIAAVGMPGGHGAASWQSAAPQDGVAQEHWVPPVLQCVATTDRGVPEVLAALDQHLAWSNRSGARTRRAHERVRLELVERLRAGVISSALTDLAGEFDRLATEVLAQRLDPYTASRALLARFRAGEGDAG